MADWELQGKVALLVMDMINDIVAEGFMGEHLGFPKAVKEAGIIPRIQTLLETFREKQLPVVHVIAEPNPVCRMPAYGAFFNHLKQDRPCSPGSEGSRIIPELTPQWEPIVRKPSIGIFSLTNLEDVLNHYSAETLVLVGVATHLVVNMGALQAACLGYNVIVVKDAVASGDKEAHEFMINRFLPLISQVTTTEELISKL